MIFITDSFLTFLVTIFKNVSSNFVAGQIFNCSSVLSWKTSPWILSSAVRGPVLRVIKIKWNYPISEKNLLFTKQLFKAERETIRFEPTMLKQERCNSCFLSKSGRHDRCDPNIWLFILQSLISLVELFNNVLPTLTRFLQYPNFLNCLHFSIFRSKLTSCLHFLLSK